MTDLSQYALKPEWWRRANAEVIADVERASLNAFTCDGCGLPFSGLLSVAPVAVHPATLARLGVEVAVCEDCYRLINLERPALVRIILRVALRAAAP